MTCIIHAFVYSSRHSDRNTWSFVHLDLQSAINIQFIYALLKDTARLYTLKKHFVNQIISSIFAENKICSLCR